MIFRSEYLIPVAIEILQKIFIKCKADGSGIKVGNIKDYVLCLFFLTLYLLNSQFHFCRLCYNPKFDDYKADYIKSLPATLKRFSDFLGTRQYFSADYVRTHYMFSRILNFLFE